VNHEQNEIVSGLARRSTLKHEALRKAEQHELDFLVLDGWVHRRHRGAQERDGGITRERPASDIERRLWDSIK
jgi:hypothetical protein